MSTWDDLCGEKVLRAIRTDVRHPFDADANGVAMDLDNITVFVFEDPSDGYRSSSNEPMITSAALYSFCAHVEYLQVPVLIRRWTKSDHFGSSCDADGIEMIDKRNGKTILFLGTDNTDDYYPSFTCDWRPQNMKENEGK